MQVSHVDKNMVNGDGEMVSYGFCYHSRICFEIGAFDMHHFIFCLNDMNRTVEKMVFNTEIGNFRIYPTRFRLLAIEE